MKRLTERDEYGNANIIALDDVMPEIYGELSFGEANGLTDALNRLAAYEDTGLTPEEITGLCSMEKRSRMAQMLRWEEADEAGRLLVLPCKVGDEAYQLIRYCDDQVCDKAYDGCGDCPGYNKIKARKCRMGSYEQIVSAMPHIGETVFLTREEAVAAMEGTKNG